MGRLAVGIFAGIPACCFLSTPALAGKTNPADYPLRVHVVERLGIRHYHRYGGGLSSLEEVEGMGEANLFENGQPIGFEFNYTCGQPILHQSAYETFMARWKKPGRVLEMLMPDIGGKPGAMNSCDLKVTSKQDTVYFRRNGGLVEEPAAQYKQWMIAHQYDPEHGKEWPVSVGPPRPGAGAGPSN